MKWHCTFWYVTLDACSFHLQLQTKKNFPFSCTFLGNMFILFAHCAICFVECIYIWKSFWVFFLPYFLLRTDSLACGSDKQVLNLISSLHTLWKICTFCNCFFFFNDSFKKISTYNFCYCRVWCKRWTFGVGV